ncbi:MAG: hypothetical protein GY756_08745 [bacterium]|nr:hypothetical protein [bacterium]
MKRQWEMIMNKGIWIVQDKGINTVQFNFTRKEYAKEFVKLLEKTF